MTIVVKALSLHNITQDETTGGVIVHKPALFNQDALSSSAESFVNTLHATYNNKSSKAYASFEAPEGQDQGQFKANLDDYLEKTTDFATFGSSVAMNLANEIEKYDIAQSGCLAVCDYEMMGGRYLFVGVIPENNHYSLSTQFDIEFANHLNTAQMSLAARIDLSNYTNAADTRYISFIKGRAGRKVRDFFMDAIGCNETIDPKATTIELTNALEDYMAVSGFDADEKQYTRKQVVAHCKDKSGTGEEITLLEVSEITGQNAENKQEFVEFVKKQEYDLDKSFPHEQSIISKTTKYSGYGNGISVGFDRNHFGTNVVYNPESDTLTIHKIPPNLKDQLMKLLSEENAKASAA